MMCLALESTLDPHHGDERVNAVWISTCVGERHG